MNQHLIQKVKHNTKKIIEVRCHIWKRSRRLPKEQNGVDVEDNFYSRCKSRTFKVQNMLDGMKDKENVRKSTMQFMIETTSEKQKECHKGERKGIVRRYEYKKPSIERHTIRKRRDNIDLQNSKLIMKGNDNLSN